MSARLQLRGDTLANWLKYDPVLMEREVALIASNPSKPKVYDLKKVGDGTRKFSELPMLGYECLQDIGDSQQFPMSQKATTTQIKKLDLSDGFILRSENIEIVLNYNNKSISIKVKSSTPIFYESGGYIDLPAMEDFMEVANNKSLFFDIESKSYFVGYQAGVDKNTYILLLFNKDGVCFSGVLSKNYVSESLYKITSENASYKANVGISLNDEIMYGAAYSHANGTLAAFELIDSTNLISIPYGATYINVNCGPVYSLSFFDASMKYLGYAKNCKIIDAAAYVSISFLKETNIDYTKLRISFSTIFDNKICSEIGTSIFGIYYGKAYQTISGKLVNLDTLDCTHLIEVPSKASLNLSISSKFYEIACFGKDNAYLGATHTPNTALKNGTKYFSISFLKTDNIDYNDVKISLQPTYSFQEIAVPKSGKIYYLFGDSITYWDDRTSWYDENVKMVAYPSYIRSVLKCTAINKGVAGNTASQITKRLLSTNLSDAYAVTYMAGANDLQSSIRIGEVGTLDDTTYIGNLSKAVEYVLRNYPSVKFYFLAPLWTNKGDIKPYAEAMESVAKYYNVPILRWDLTSCLNSMTADTYYVNEGTTRLHPNNIGHARLADSLIPFLQNY